MVRGNAAAVVLGLALFVAGAAGNGAQAAGILEMLGNKYIFLGVVIAGAASIGAWRGRKDDSMFAIGLWILAFAVLLLLVRYSPAEIVLLLTGQL